MALASLPAHPLLQTLPLQIAEHIGDRIVDGTHAPGSRLREVELAESFEVSRATVREALRLLEQRGLVRILPQRGAHVTQLSVKELHDLFEVRASLLATGSRLVAERRNADDARRLRGMLDDLRRAMADVDAYTRTSAELVRTLAALSGNEVLAGYIGDFAMRIGRYTRMGLANLTNRKRSLATWEQLIAAIERGDGSAAAAHHARLALDNRGAALEELQRQSQAQPPAPSRPRRVVRDGR